MFWDILKILISWLFLSMIIAFLIGRWMRIQDDKIDRMFADEAKKQNKGKD